MPYRIVQRGNDYFVVGPTRQYKRKTLEKARAYKRLLEAKEKAKPAVSQKVVQKQHVVVNVNAPPRRRRGAPARTSAIAPHHTSETVIRMVPQITPMQAVEQARRAIPIREPVKDTLGDTNVIGKDLEKAVADLENIASLIRDETFRREKNFDDRLEPNVFQPRIERTSSEPIGRGSAISDITQPMSSFPEASVSSVGRDRAELQRMTIIQLREILRNRGETIGKKNKAQLIDAILGLNP